jgi:hypothetical protein
MDFFEPENWYQRSQSIGTLGRIAQGGRTNELLGSINQTLQQAIAEEKSEKQRQRLIENVIFEMQKRLNRSRYQFEKSPNEAFALLYETKEYIDLNRNELQAVHSLEYKRLFEALENDCSNVWEWAVKNISEDTREKYHRIADLKKAVQNLERKNAILPNSKIWIVNFFAMSGLVALAGYFILQKLPVSLNTILYVLGGLFVVWLLSVLLPPKIAVLRNKSKIHSINKCLAALKSAEESGC